MQRSLNFLLPLCLLLAPTASVQAADAQAGEKLHAKNCVACHASMTGNAPDTLYTRKQRKVTSREGLTKQVRRCEQSLGLRWFDDDIENVAAYLNAKFYRF